MLVALPPVHASDFSEADLLTDIPTVVSASRMPQPLAETPAAVTLIDREMIEASAALNVPDLLRLVPGIQAFHVSYNTFGVTYHGVSDNFPHQMEVQVNGRSIYIPLLSAVTWETLGLVPDDIERIEVIRGSNMPSQGTNAFLGAINIITRYGTRPEGSTLSTTQGERGEQRYRFSHQGHAVALDYQFNAGYQQNDGNKLFQDRIDKSYFNSRHSFTPSLNDQFDIQLGFSQGEVFTGDGDHSGNQFIGREFHQNYQQLRWLHTLDLQQELQLQFYRNRLKADVDPIPAEAVPQVQEEAARNGLSSEQFTQLLGIDGTLLRPSREHGDTTVNDLELLYRFQSAGRFNLSSGLGYRYESIKSDAILSRADRQSSQRRRLFSNLSYQLSPEWIWHLGALYEEDERNRAFSPRTGLSYQLTPEQTLRLSLSRARRLPSLLERKISVDIRQNASNNFALLDQQFCSNDELKPELNESIELGYLLRPAGKHGGLFDLRLYQEDISDALTDHFIPFADQLDNRCIQVHNGARWRARGVEFQLKQSLSPADFMVLSYGYNNVEGIEDRGLKGIEPLDDTAPLHTASLLWKHQFSSDLSFSLAGYFMSTVNWLEGATVARPRKAYRRADMQLAKLWRLRGDNEAEIALIVQNLFDEEYSEFYEFNSFRRRGYVRLALRY
ncbi:TonB-dependent receptor plug domain-containing protein [Marinobacterium jannaschii]|uniref:TonB-dependent receptor plug domain-containing protein n=1 Tax=Marinobacterium jannaschii TaxID=64970 RepID=UPI00147213D7|nr:TonB-dependent receptor [Marinobacterium jannaschii]